MSKRNLFILFMTASLLIGVGVHIGLIIGGAESREADAGGATTARAAAAESTGRGQDRRVTATRAPDRSVAVRMGDGGTVLASRETAPPNSVDTTPPASALGQTAFAHRASGSERAGTERVSPPEVIRAARSIIDRALARRVLGGADRELLLALLPRLGSADRESLGVLLVNAAETGALDIESDTP
jgi:hypothetical protein